MNRFVRFFNQNRKTIFWAILIIALILIVIQLLNQYVKNKNEKERENILSRTQQESRESNILKENNELISDKSLISDETLSEGANQGIQTIKEFVNACNNQNLNLAYGFISDDCKEIMFSNIDEFKKIYYDSLFGDGQKSFTIENWNNNIYRVKFNNANALSTGNVESSGTKTDYITIVKDSEDQNKLNINNFIEKREINKETNYKDIKVKTDYLYQFMDYCEISYDMENNTYRTVLMDDLSNPYTMYLVDSDENKYSADTSKLVSERLKMGIDQKTHVNIKYYCAYGSTKEIDKAVFSKVVNNVETYDFLRDKSQYGQYYSIDVQL